MKFKKGDLVTYDPRFEHASEDFIITIVTHDFNQSTPHVVKILTPRGVRNVWKSCVKLIS